MGLFWGSGCIRHCLGCYCLWPCLFGWVILLVNCCMFPDGVSATYGMVCVGGFDAL